MKTTNSNILALIPALLIGVSSFANTDAANFLVECRGGNIHSGQYQAEKISIPLDGGSKAIPLKKLNNTAGAFAKFDQDKGIVGVGYTYAATIGLHLEAFASTEAAPGAKVLFHQDFPGGIELDCTGLVE